MIELEDNIIKRIGNYTLLKTLSLSSLSSVYLVTDENEKKFVLKVISNPNNKICLQNEVNALKVLNNHPNILTLNKIFRDSNHWFFVYDYIEEGDLYNLTKIKPLKQENIFNLLRQMVKALRFSHNNGYIHNNIKPDNILKQNDTFFLYDWGLVHKTVDSQLCDIKADDLYLAPEVFKGYISPKSDIYSLGATLFYLLNQKRTYDLDSADDYSYIVYSHCKLDLDLSNINSHKLRYLISSMMHKNDEKRISLDEIEYIINNDDFALSVPSKNINYNVIKKRSKYSLYNELCGDEIAIAINSLGLLFETDENIKDLKKAFEFYQKASILGLTKAHYNLALCYLNGKYIKKDEKKAYELFEKAGLNKHSKSLCYLAYFHEKGIFVKKNINISLRLYLKAANHGNIKAYKKLKEYSSFKEE